MHNLILRETISILFIIILVVLVLTEIIMSLKSDSQPPTMDIDGFIGVNIIVTISIFYSF